MSNHRRLIRAQQCILDAATLGDARFGHGRRDGRTSALASMRALHRVCWRSMAKSNAQNNFSATNNVSSIHFLVLFFFSRLHSSYQKLIFLFSGATSNKLFICTLETENATSNSEHSPRKVLLRISYNPDKDVNALAETIVFTLLSERGLGPRLLGVFNDGRLEEFINVSARFMGFTSLRVSLVYRRVL